MNRTTAIKWLKALTYIGIYGGLLIPLVFVPVVIFPFVFSKLIYFQILIGLTFPAYLILAWIEPQYRPRWTPLYIAVIAYFVALGLSVIFAVDVSRAWWGNQERMNGLFTLLHFFAWFTMSSALLKTWGQWKKILLYEVVLSAIMASVSILQKPFPSLLLFPVSDRPGGLVDNPIYMAGYQIFNLFFIVLLWLKGASRNTKIWLALFAVLDIGAFILAQSRGALVGLFAGLFMFAVAYVLMSKNKRTKQAVLGSVGIVFVLYGALFAMRNSPMIVGTPLGRLTNFQVTTETRFMAWEIGWKGFLERPLTGWGLDDFHILFNLKYNPKSLEFGYYETWFDRAHNTVVDTLAMAGIFGFLTFFAMFGALFYSVIKSYRKGWLDMPTTAVLIGLPVAYFVQNLFVFDQPAGFTMSFFLFALVVSASLPAFQATEGVPPVPTGTPRAIPWVAFGILQFAALLLVWRTTVLPAEASYISIKSNNYFAAGLLPQAFDLAKQASTIPTPYLDEQAFLQSRNIVSLMDSGNLQKFPQWREYHDLVKDLNIRSLAEHPQNTNPRFVYARFLDAFGSVVPEDLKDAEKEYQAALDSSPDRQQILFSFARYYIEIGNKDKGMELLKQAENLDPNIGEAHWYVGVSLVYDFNKKEDGAKEIIASVKTTAPYQLKNVRDALTLAYAYQMVGDKDGFLSVLPQLSTLGGGDLQLFMEFARIAEQMGLMPQRDEILRAIVNAQPSAGPALAPVLNGSVKTIDESLKQSGALTATSTPQTQTPASQAAATTSTTTGTGPRK